MNREHDDSDMIPKVTGHFDMTKEEREEANQTLHEILRQIGVLQNNE